MRGGLQRPLDPQLLISTFCARLIFTIRIWTYRYNYKNITVYTPITAYRHFVAYLVRSSGYYGNHKGTLSVVIFLFRLYEIIFRLYEILFRLYEILFRLYEILFRLYEMISFVRNIISFVRNTTKFYFVYTK